MGARTNFVQTGRGDIIWRTFFKGGPQNIAVKKMGGEIKKSEREGGKTIERGRPTQYLCEQESQENNSGKTMDKGGIQKGNNCKS